MLLFNNKLKHSSWGGGDRRRMFTYNFEQYFPDNLIGSLRKLVVPYHERGDDAPYGEALMRTAGPERMRHLEQRLQNLGRAFDLTSDASSPLHAGDRLKVDVPRGAK